VTEVVVNDEAVSGAGKPLIVHAETKAKESATA